MTTKADLLEIDHKRAAELDTLRADVPDLLVYSFRMGGFRARLWAPTLAALADQMEG